MKKAITIILSVIFVLMICVFGMTIFSFMAINRASDEITTTIERIENENEKVDLDLENLVNEF